MRLSTIEFNDYKRLDRASCNVDGHTIAFIGPNESGKSSVLQGLAWLTDDRDDAACLYASRIAGRDPTMARSSYVHATDSTLKTSKLYAASTSTPAHRSTPRQ